jgi:multidrug efflux pump subunit AcrA (membrane-fusion protein)
VRFGDATGRPQILELLQPAKVIAPGNGTVTDTGVVGSGIRGGGLVAKLQHGDRSTEELRSPITGRIRSISAPEGSRVSAGQEVATIAPDAEQAWEALRALYIVGQPEDIAAILPFQRELPDVPDRVRQQAMETEKAIRAREK